MMVYLILGCDDEKILLGERLESPSYGEGFDAQWEPKDLLNEHCLELRIIIIEMGLLLLIEVVILQSNDRIVCVTFSRMKPRCSGGRSRWSRSRTWIEAD